MSSANSMDFDERKALLLVKSEKGKLAYKNGLEDKGNNILIEKGVSGLIAVAVDRRELLEVEGVDLSGLEYNQIVDLSSEGDRWEGTVLKNKPCGWGVLYDRNNQKVYEGFRVGELNVCYGVHYYSDISQIEYEGCWCDGSRWGRGVQYDRKGDVVYRGEWLDDRQLETRVVMSSEVEPLHNHIEEWVVSDACCNGEEWGELDLSVMPLLRLVVVGNGCFRHVTVLRLIGLEELVSVLVGSDSFVSGTSGGEFYLKHCRRLREWRVGSGSFKEFSMCEIEDVEALEVIDIGGVMEGCNSFFCASLELRSCCVASWMMNRPAFAQVSEVRCLCVLLLHSRGVRE